MNGFVLFCPLQTGCMETPLYEEQNEIISSDSMILNYYLCFVFNSNFVVEFP